MTRRMPGPSRRVGLKRAGRGPGAKFAGHWLVIRAVPASDPGDGVDYGVRILPSAEREMRRLPRTDLSRIMARIDALARTPRPPGTLKLSGTIDQYRIRQGVYRILYRIDDAARLVFVYSVSHRKDAYR